MKEIDIFTFISSNSSAYAELMKKSMETFRSGEYKLNWKCIESANAERLPVGFDCIDKGPDVGHGSINHGLAMNLALKHVKSDNVIFVDADIVITFKDWDKLLMKRFNHVDCFGFDYGNKGPRYTNFPVVFFFCFKKEIMKKVDLDFRPKITKGGESPFRFEIKDPKQAKLLGKKIGSQIKCDTGWQLPLIIKGAGFKSEVVNRFTGKQYNGLLPFRDEKQRKFCAQKPEHMAEWHYRGDLFGSHKQASRNMPLDGKWGSTWRERINLYTMKKYGVKL